MNHKILFSIFGRCIRYINRFDEYKKDSISLLANRLLNIRERRRTESYEHVRAAPAPSRKWQIPCDWVHSYQPTSDANLSSDRRLIHIQLLLSFRCMYLWLYSDWVHSRSEMNYLITSSKRESNESVHFEMVARGAQMRIQYYSFCSQIHAISLSRLRLFASK